MRLLTLLVLVGGTLLLPACGDVDLEDEDAERDGLATSDPILSGVSKGGSSLDQGRWKGVSLFVASCGRAKNYIIISR
jgi:hypothetical protein